MNRALSYGGVRSPISSAFPAQGSFRLPPGLHQLLVHALKVCDASASAIFEIVDNRPVVVSHVGDLAREWFVQPDAFSQAASFDGPVQLDSVNGSDEAFTRWLCPGACSAIGASVPFASASAGGIWYMIVASERTSAFDEAAQEHVQDLAGLAANFLQLAIMGQEAESRLLEAEHTTERFEYITELAGVGGWEIDPVTSTVTWTEQTCRIHDCPSGYAPSLEEWFAQFDPAYRDRLRQAYREAVRSGTGWKLDLPIHTKTGRQIWISSVCQPVFRDDGSIRILGSVLDVSARRGAQDEIDRSQRLYRSTLNALSEGILVAGGDGIVRWHNGAAEDILECPTIYENMTHLEDIECHVLPEEVAILGLGEDEFADCALLAGLLRTRESRDVSLEVKVGPNQVRKWFRCRSEPLVSRDDGEFVGLVISVEDITTMKRNEDILNEAFEAIPNGFAIYDQDDRILMANASYRAAYMSGRRIGETRETYKELLLRNLTEGRFEDLSGEDFDEWEAWIEERVSGCFFGAGKYLDQLDDKRWVQTSSRITPSSYRADYFADVTDIKNNGAVLEAVFECYPGGVALFDRSRRLTRLNGTMIEMLAIDQAFLDNSPTLESMIARNASRQGLEGSRLKQVVERALSRFSDEEAISYERSFRDGTVQEIKGIPMPDGSLLTIIEDITVRKRQEKNLKELERQARKKSEELELTFANMDQGFSVFDRNGCLQFWNQKYIEVFDKPPGEVYRGISIREVLEKEAERGEFDRDIDLHLAEMKRRLANGEVVTSYFHLRNGNLVCCAHAPMPAGGWIGTQEEISPAHPDYGTYKRKTQVDPVTGHANQKWLVDEVEGVLDDLRLNGGSAALLVLSSRFAKERGRSDRSALDSRTTLIFANRIRECIRPSDLLARLDDGRFAVLCRDIKGDSSVLTNIAERVLEFLDEPFTLNGEKRAFYNHIGIVPLSDADQDVADVLVKAKDASRRAAASLRSGFVVASEDMEPDVPGNVSAETQSAQ